MGELTKKRIAELRQCGLPKDCAAYSEHMELLDEVERLKGCGGEFCCDCNECTIGQLKSERDHHLETLQRLLSFPMPSLRPEHDDLLRKRHPDLFKEKP